MKDPLPDPQRHARIRELFGRADSLPPAEREAFVRQAAGADTKLADAVLALLRAQAEAVDATIDVQRAVAEALSPTQPTEIGPYQILDTLGEGGMGTVYLAEQTSPVKRKVALKLIKLGMDSKAVVARFEQERQALALMQHDGIAKVYDCGTSERGQPFFVMELVKGVPLNEFCEQSRLTLPQRLLLMKQVCAAVQHAHQKGVVHRDLKPGNVLVSDEGGKLQVKIIDFGLAKAMGQKLVEATLFTEAGQVVGTPEYMAPEQADPTNADIDTRADIYSLGVMLYEVLVGQLPFSGQALRKAGLLEMQRVLREVSPPKPSTKLTTIADSAAAVAQARRMSVGALQKALKNELDWVVLKALEKDRNRRYDTANAMAADLQRFLDHEPLVAGPPSTGYRLRLFVQKHRGQVLAAAAVFVTLLGGGIGTFVQYLRADANAVFAQENAQRANEKAGDALREKLRADDKTAEATENAAQLAGKVREFDQLAGVVLYERAIANEAELYPAWPHQVEAMERWLREDAGKLLLMRPEIEATVASLRQRALPWSDAEQQRDREAHPKFAEWQALERKVAALRRAQAVRAEPASFVEPSLDAAQVALDTPSLHAFARSRWIREGDEEKPRLWGEEAVGLAAARLLVQRAAAGDAALSSCTAYEALAWAAFANGLDEAAVAAAERAIEAVAEEGSHKDDHRRDLADVRAAIAAATTDLEAAERELAALADEVEARRTWSFAPEDESQRFLHDTLAELLGKLGSLAQKEKAAVDQRLSWAKQIQQLSLAHPNARHTWAAVRAAIAQNPNYAGQMIELREQDITGLAPIGENPVTHLWEFYELRSAWDGKQDPRAIAIPSHEPDGSIEVTGELGIVFVLLPGGTFLMGAQKTDPNGPNFDPAARDDETPHEVTLSPFFLARYELTQGQWARLWTGDASLRSPSQYKAGENLAGSQITLANPVESVDWTMCDTLLTRHGLVLPTEAQWEYGCRAGTTTPWIVGFEDLQKVANLAAAEAQPRTSWTCESWRDGHVVHAPVGTYAPNGFGLYDMHGNVWEWCRDWYGDYGTERPGDGLRSGSGSSNRCNRGGGFNNPAALARSTYRYDYAPTVLDLHLGLRPARTSRL